MNLSLAKPNAPLSYLQSIDVRIYAIIISCIFSIININNNPLLNNDAYVYLKAAELFLNEGINPTLNNYGWVGYSIVIALLSKMLPIGLLNCAYLFNIAIYAVLTYSFITLVTEHHKSQQLKIFAALVILVFPHLNELRNLLIRDIGYSAFCITALLQLIRFNRHHKVKNAVGWCLAMFAAIFFRLEGLLLLFAPLAILLSSTTSLFQRLKKLIIINSIILSFAGLLLLLAMFKDIDIFELFQYALRYYQPRFTNFLSIIMENSDKLNQAIFNLDFFPGHSGHGYLILTISYIYILLANAINSFSVPFSIILCYGVFKNKFRMPAGYASPIFIFIFISALYLLAFIFIMQFLTERYSILLSLTLLTFIPLCLDSIYNNAKAKNKTKFFKVFFGSLATLLLIDSLISFGYSKQYISNSINWTQNNLSPENHLITNHRAIAYFSGLVENYDSIDQDLQNTLGNITPGDYLALELSHRENEFVTLLEQRQGLELLVEFSNKRNDQVRIYYFSP